VNGRSIELLLAYHGRLQIWRRGRPLRVGRKHRITGALVQWLRDNLGIIEKSPDVELLARTVNDNGGVYFVPAFSGLYAP